MAKLVTREIEAIAVDVVHRAIKLDPRVIAFGDVTVVELLKLAAYDIDTCPRCGSTAWVNIDCDLCNLCSQVLAQE